LETVGSWPCEEVFAAFIQEHLWLFREAKSVLELGAGCSGLAAFVLASQLEGGKIKVTDGNQLCVESKTILSVRTPETLGTKQRCLQAQ